jgi:hypothetical protein
MAPTSNRENSDQDVVLIACEVDVFFHAGHIRISQYGTIC